MSFKLKKGIFNVKCPEENCDFELDIDVKQNILGFTEKEVENNSKKIAGVIAKLQHDLDVSKKHFLNNPLITVKSCICEAVSEKSSLIINHEEAIKYVEFKSNEVIIKKDDLINFVCEVVKGSAYSTQKKSKMYEVGDNFGAYHLLINQKKSADIVAGNSGATIAIYDLKELSLKDPGKTRELYQKSMDDILQSMNDMENVINDLQLKLEYDAIEKNNLKEEITIYEDSLKK